MGEIVNLRRERKRASRERDAAKAVDNRVLHGLSKAERALATAHRELDERHIDAHRLDPNSPRET